jgi:hypothetical protein
MLKGLITVAAALVGATLLGCDAASREVLIADGPIALDTAAVVLRLDKPYRHNGDPTILCLAVDPSLYDLRDSPPGRTIHRKQPGEPAWDYRWDTTPDPHGIAVGGAILTATGDQLALRPYGYAHGVAPWECLHAPQFREGMVVSSVSLRASRPLSVDKLVWDVTYR